MFYKTPDFVANKVDPYPPPPYCSIPIPVGKRAHRHSVDGNVARACHLVFWIWLVVQTVILQVALQVCVCVCV